jgi:hypothetical protein
LRADAPQARRKTAAEGASTPAIRLPGARKKPVAAEQAANTEIFTRQRVRYGLMKDIM